MTQPFKHLFSSIEIGNTVIQNRILTTAHQTNHVVNGIPTEDLDAYHEARAKGGLGLIILEAGAVHPSGMLTTNTIASFDPRIVDAYKRLTSKIHPYGTKIFAQLFHGGREVVSSTYRHPAWAPSAVPSLRFGTMPRAMTKEQIKEVIEGYADSALLAKQGGLDGVEICCSHGYLPAQFWSSHTNRRTDEYGGTFANRMRFIVETIERVWEKVGEDFTVGIRMSADEKTMDGTTIKDAVQIVEYLAEHVRLDFINVTAGDSSTFAGSTHIVPPSPMKHAYVAPDAFKIRMAGAIPVFVGSRIVDPVDGEKIISSGKADMVAMTRATIVDPELPNKAKTGQQRMIDACIGCLQACIGHYHKGLPIGCVQNPEAGKEREVQTLFAKETTKKSVLIVGAGPAGLEAAVTAAKRGHDVTLVDRQKRIGGKLNTMRKAPMRQEMAETMIDNYTKQLEVSHVTLELNTNVTLNYIKEKNPDVVILATGSLPYEPPVPGLEDARIIYIDDLFDSSTWKQDEAAIVFDFGGDWAAVEGALYLAEKGCDTTLVTARLYAAENVHQYLRNEYLKRLKELNVTIIPQHDFGGINEAGKVVIRNLFTHDRTPLDKTYDHIVLSVGRVPTTQLFDELQDAKIPVKLIGDCLAPRTIEEATTEGLFTALRL